MVLEQLWRAVPGLENAVRQQPLAADRESAWVMLRALLQAPAPSTATTLPNGIIDQVSDIAAALGLVDRLDPDLGGVGNAGLWLGVAGGRADLLVVAHLDRLTFGIDEIRENGRSAGVLAVSASGAFTDMARTPARAFRLERGRLAMAARGTMRADERGLEFQAEDGSLLPTDLITLDGRPHRQGDWVRSGGIDNAAGVLSALGAAAVLRRVEEALLEYDRRCVFVFPDRQDFSLAALMAAGPALSPTLGALIVDVQPVAADGPGTGVQHEGGAAYVLSGRDGLIVPLNYRQLTRALAQALNDARPGTAQLRRLPQRTDTRTDCGVFHERILGYAGPPISQTQAGEETVHLQDIQASVWWLACYIAVVLNLAPGVAGEYALGR